MPDVLPRPGPEFLAAPAELELTLLIPARGSGDALAATAREARRYLAELLPGAFEIILVPNGNPPKPGEPSDRTLEVAEELARAPHSVDEGELVCRPHRAAPGAALRTGIEHARGRYIFFTDADLPYDLEFIARALECLRAGDGLVTGNRRLDTSCFDVPVGLLPLAYRRHRLGLRFNRLVRMWLPIRTTDTQAGIKGMSRALARDAFARLECPGFFFDLELFLVARGGGFSRRELPVTLYLNTEKSTVRVLREAWLALYWVGRVTSRWLRGEYNVSPRRKAAA